MSLRLLDILRCIVCRPRQRQEECQAVNEPDGRGSPLGRFQEAGTHPHWLGRDQQGEATPTSQNITAIVAR